MSDECGIILVNSSFTIHHHHSSFIIHHSSFISRHSFATHYSSLITHHSLLITHHSSLITHYSSLIIHHSPLPIHAPTTLLTIPLLVCECADDRDSAGDRLWPHDSGAHRKGVDG